MKTRKSNLPRLLSLALVLLLALTAVVPVFATTNPDANTDNLKITIHNNTGLPAMTTTQFGVYQLFTGTPKNEGDVGANDWDATHWNDYILADVEWGASINKPAAQTDLLNALKALKPDETDWLESGAANPFERVTTAAQLAAVLVDQTNKFMQGFADFLMTGNGGDSFLEDLKLEGESDTDSKGQQTLTYDLKDYGTGYYIFQDQSNPAESKAVSEYIVAVMGSQDIDLKASVPEVQKWIDKVGTAAGGKKGTTADIGEAVHFVLQGTLPKNIGDFDSYAYTFHDTLANGLNFDQATAGLTVTVGETALTPDRYEIVTSGTGDDCNLHIVIENLKAAGFPPLTADTKITVKYDAALDGDAVIGAGADSQGNKNTVKLQYSNDPHKLDATAETAVDSVRVYTFGLDLKKVGTGSGDTDGLAGASFTLQKGDQYAEFETEADGKKVFKQWVDESTVTDLIDKYDEAKKAWDEAQPTAQPETGAEKTELEAAIAALEPYILSSTTGGEMPNVIGLDADTYTLTEVITPAGYNTMGAVTVVIGATVPANTGNLDSFTYTPTGTVGETAGMKTYDATGDNSERYQTGLIDDTLENVKAPFLPFTGGIGTLIFYVLGIALIAGAVSYLVIVSKKRKKAEQNA